MKPNDQPLQINALAPGHSHLIEANAGTGKTYAIANLFLRFVLEGIAVQNLLVVTFTRAATDELRGRIRKRLHEARLMLRKGCVNENEDEFFRRLPAYYPEGQDREQALQYLTLALLSINEAPIHTIHGFCQQALTDQAFSSGQAFELEQADDAILTLHATQDWWRQRTYELSKEELADFHKLFPDFNRLQNLLAPLLKAPSPRLQPSPANNMDQAREALMTKLKTFAELWQEQGTATRELLLTHKALSRSQTSGQKPESLEPVLDKLDSLVSQNLQDQLEPELLTYIAHNQLDFKKTGKNKSDFDREPFWQAEHLLTDMQKLQRLSMAHELTSACDFVLEQLTGIKQQQGLLSFDDMIRYLHKALHSDNQSADELAHRLATQYPLILVDEFQDTDLLQYAIFNRIHAADKIHTLIMIGDPKQAIYGFRGGDIFTYIQARRDADQRWSLSTNWRSTPEMIEAVNSLFTIPNAFTYTDIPYEPSHPAPEDKRKARPLIIDGKPEPALVVQDLPRKDDGRPLGKEQLREHVHQSVAQRIAELLSNDTAFIGDEPLRPKHIAILVRGHHEAKGVRQALLDRGVRAVSVGKDHVWDSDEAEGLRLLLEAALLPEDRYLLRQALTAPFLNLNAEDLLTLIKTPRHWSAWVELMHETGRLWQQRGFMPAFQTLLHGLAPVLNTTTEKNPLDWLTRITDPERTLTNLFHIAELLQQASKEHPGGEQLLVWMRQQQKPAPEEEHILRLESDEELVKIVTMHASKGLEFPVVFAPYLWSCRPARHRDNRSMRWHEEDNGVFQHYYSPWLDTNNPVLIRADHERLAEDIRLAYVTLTRAGSHCHVFFGAAGSHDGHAGQTAFAWLLSGSGQNLDQEYFEVNSGNISLQSLTQKAGISVQAAHENETLYRLSNNSPTVHSLDATLLKRTIRNNWQIGSYTAMTRDVHQVSRISSTSTTNDFAMQYPAGARIGNFLHALLQYIDPTRLLPLQLKRIVPSLSLRHGLDPEQDLDKLGGWLDNILHTPLDNANLTLAGLQPAQTLHELEFSLSSSKVNCKALNILLQKQTETEHPALKFDTFQGMLTGFIDLVFEYQDQYYIADYKSNLLGRCLGDYTTKKLRQEIDARRYDLQYLIYTLALHRHLRQRIQNYDYQRDFGGVYYLFLRAMRPQSSVQHGVYFDRPDIALIDQLDRDIFAFTPEKST